MTTIREALEEKNKDRFDESKYWSMSAEYEDAFSDCKILAWESVGDYQGDYFAIVQGPDGRIGFVKIGYGSCSGCDALQGTIGYRDDSKEEREKCMKEVLELLEGIRGEVHWERDKAEMKAYLTSEKIDKEILETYMEDKEKQEVWRKLEASVSPKVSSKCDTVKGA